LSSVQIDIYRVGINYHPYPFISFLKRICSRNSSHVTGWDNVIGGIYASTHKDLTSTFCVAHHYANLGKKINSHTLLTIYISSFSFHDFLQCCCQTWEHGVGRRVFCFTVRFICISLGLPTRIGITKSRNFSFSLVTLSDILVYSEHKFINWDRERDAAKKEPCWLVLCLWSIYVRVVIGWQYLSLKNVSVPYFYVVYPKSSNLRISKLEFNINELLVMPTFTWLPVIIYDEKLILFLFSLFFLWFL
jgi:hypothetical protein